MHHSINALRRHPISVTLRVVASVVVRFSALLSVSTSFNLVLGRLAGLEPPRATLERGDCGSSAAWRRADQKPER